MTELVLVAMTLISLALALYVGAAELSDRRFSARMADAGRSRIPLPEVQRGLRKGS
jgi:hypothetical protein